jgi:hypothetical protein
MKAGRRIVPEQNVDRNGQRSENHSDRYPPLPTKATPIESAGEDAHNKNQKFQAGGGQ